MYVADGRYLGKGKHGLFQATRRISRGGDCTRIWHAQLYPDKDCEDFAAFLNKQLEQKCVHNVLYKQVRNDVSGTVYYDAYVIFKEKYTIHTCIAIFGAGNWMVVPVKKTSVLKERYCNNDGYFDAGQHMLQINGGRIPKTCSRLAARKRLAASGQPHVAEKATLG